MYHVIHREEGKDTEKIFTSVKHILEFYSTFPDSFRPYLKDLSEGKPVEILYSHDITLIISKS